MFVDFKNVVDTGRVKLPFGIAQIGKSFRNEITPRNFIFRSREFEQMEMEYFIHEDADWAKCHEEWIDWCRRLAAVHRPARRRTSRATPTRRRNSRSTRKGTMDIMFKYPFGVQELWGIAARGNYDLTQHAQRQRQAAGNVRRGDEEEIRPARHRARRRRRPHFPRRALRRLRGGGRHGREGQRREAHRAPPLAAHRAGQGRHSPAAQEQGAARRPRARSSTRN